METTMYGEGVTLVGCGAQAKYVMEILARTGKDIFQVLDPIGKKVGKRLGDFVIASFQESEFVQGEEAGRRRRGSIICSSDNKLKSKLFKKAKYSTDFINAIHPDSIIASTARLGTCLIVNGGAIIQPYVRIGNGCMIHAGVVIEHDCVIEDFVNIGPGATLAGSVRVGEGTTVFSGAVVVPNVRIGKHAVIGAGSLVFSDVSDGVLAYGNPAEVVRDLRS